MDISHIRLAAIPARSDIQCPKILFPYLLPVKQLPGSLRAIGVPYTGPWATAQWKHAAAFYDSADEGLLRVKAEWWILVSH